MVTITMRVMTSPTDLPSGLQSAGPAVLLGPEGQGILGKYYYGNASTNYGFKKWRPERDYPLDKYEKELERWEKLLKETGRKSM